MFISEKLLWFGLQCCLYCGSLERGSDGLCRVCSDDLFSWRPRDNHLFHQVIHKLDVVTLFEWFPGKQEVLSKLIHALKGPKNRKLWQFYADEFMRALWMEQIVQEAFLLIPAPSRKGKPDHALRFAQGLLNAGAGVEIYPCLSRGKDQGPQKKQSRSERERAFLNFAENFTLKDFNSKSVGKHVIFVDDVVTTGSTARAAWKALGRPRYFAVWALAQRHLSCGASMDLI